MSLAFAQRPGGAPPTPQDFVQRRVDGLTRLLTLTTAQQEQVKTILTNAASAKSAIADTAKTARQALEDAVKKNDIGGIDQAAATIGSVTAQTTSLDAKADAAVYQLLTPDQQSKFGQFPGPGGFGRGMGPDSYGGRRR